jgi:hypothetical protein
LISSKKKLHVSPPTKAKRSDTKNALANPKAATDKVEVDQEFVVLS